MFTVKLSFLDPSRRDCNIRKARLLFTSINFLRASEARGGGGFHKGFLGWNA